jgi:hypothetical protein
MKSLVNTCSTQLAVWALALALIVVNFLAVFEQAEGLADGHAWVWVIVAVCFAAYFAFVCYIARPGLVQLRLALGCGGGGSTTLAAPLRSPRSRGNDDRGLGGPPLDRASLEPVDAAIGPQYAALERRDVAVA